LRILLINPNTSDSVTALVAKHVETIAGDAASFVPVTGRFGARYIQHGHRPRSPATPRSTRWRRMGTAATRFISPASAIPACWRCAKSPMCP
jgi:hypothetical protein